MNKIRIISNKKISAIYFALLLNGYDYFHFEKNEELIIKLNSFVNCNLVDDFFANARQKTCETYPYWPRVALLETASFFIDNNNKFDFENTYKKINSFTNISESERNDDFWKWIKLFPKEIAYILNSKEFNDYYLWERDYISSLNCKYDNELKKIAYIINKCISVYNLNINSVEIIINPIKCAYSADYHIIDNKFVFSSGQFSFDSIIHEILHLVVHPHMKEIICDLNEINLESFAIDESYFIDESEQGKLNTLEEFIVRCLTSDVLDDYYPEE